MRKIYFLSVAFFALLSLPSFAQNCNLTAAFSAEQNPANPFQYSFSNLSTGFAAGDSIRWTFGDGTVSYDLHPSHTYANAGTYNVCLRVKKPQPTATSPACVSEICHPVTITASTACTLQAYFTNDSLDSPLIHFFNQSSGFIPGDSISWTFGDGTASHEPNPTHTFAAPGTYHVCLHVVKHQAAGSVPCTSEYCKNITIAQHCEIHPNYTHHPDSSNPRKIIFTNTTQPATAAATVSWNFGDGSSATTWNATHEYAQPGRYYVCLTVHSGSCVATHCDSLTVTGPTALDCNHIIAGFYDTRDSIIPNKIKFTATANAPILDQVWTIVKLPNGNTITFHANNPTYTFPDTGSYRVCLHAKFANDCTKEVCKIFHITSVPNSAACMQLYPNPAHDVINAVINLGAPSIIHAYIYNTSNVLVAHREQQGVAGSNLVSVNIGLLPAGLYTIKLVWEGHSCSATFFKQ